MNFSPTRGKVTHEDITWKDPWYRGPELAANELVYGHGWNEWFKSHEYGDVLARLHREAESAGVDPSVVVAWAKTEPANLEREITL